MKIFITGADGQLAKSLLGIYSSDDLYLATRKKLDVTNKKQVLKQVASFRPDIIFHLASITRGDECAKDPEKAYEVNVNGTKNIVEASKRYSAELLFVSTNEVFNGKKKSRYTEKDIPNPITVVGKNKYEAEKIIKENLKKYYIVRTSWLYSKWGTNFLHVVTNKARNDKKIELVSDEVSSPTSSLDLSTAIKKLIQTKKYGIYHISNIGTVSRLDFAKKAFQIIKLRGVKIIPVKLEKYPRLSKPPLFTPLSNKKVRKLGILMPRWDTSLERFLKIANI